jgi:PPK2 family polyphosphate:nucleotide phosphotransferase
MKIKISDFCISNPKKVNLEKWPTCVKSVYKSKKKYHKMLKSQVEVLQSIQRLHYASNGYAVLVIFQGMDAAGKDSAIRQVMSGVNPQGCQVFSFKQPSSQELEHDFLWRTYRCLPERGRIGIFNRSYYEEVLVVRVHPEILHQRDLPANLITSHSIWTDRYRSINEMEAHLNRNGTKIIKIFLHQSKNEQRKRFIKRIDNSEKNWKLSVSDIRERKLWDQYMEAYENCLGNTGTSYAPWYVVPADDKKNARLIISEIILETFKHLKMAYPKASTERRRELKVIRKGLKK